MAEPVLVATRSGALPRLKIDSQCCLRKGNLLNVLKFEMGEGSDMKANRWVTLCAAAAVFLIGMSVQAQKMSPAASASFQEGAKTAQNSDSPAEAGSADTHHVDRPGSTNAPDAELGTLKLKRSRQTALGHWLFWPGVATSLAGVVLIEVDSHGQIGVAGAITAGVGVTAIAAGAAVLGLVYGSPRVYTLSASSVSVVPVRKGVAVGYSRTF